MTEKDAWEKWLEIAQQNPERAISETIIKAFGETPQSKQVVAALTRLHDRSIELANVDPLTGIWNRRAWLAKWESELKRAERQGRELAVVLIDLDGFKRINDSEGHAAGDKVLQEVAQIIAGSVRETDWVGRWGGDEFIIGMVEGNALAAQDLLRRIRVRIGPLAARFHFTRFGISGGWALYPDHGKDAEDLIVYADKHLYRDKEEPVRKTEKASILLIDDDLTLLTICQEILRRAHHPCETASNWETAKQTLQENLPDLIFLDLNLGVGHTDGWQALAELQEDDIWRTIPVVLMTGQADRDAIEQAVLKGVMDYLAKPFTPDELLSAIDQALIL